MRNSAVCLLETAYRLRPEGEAVEDSASCLTYAELRDSSRRVAAGLLRQCASPAPVMVFLSKSVGMLQGMFGALYAGRAYVPADSATPPARLAHILANLHPCAVVTDGALAP